MLGFCEHGGEPSGPIKCSEFLDYLRNCLLWSLSRLWPVMPPASACLHLLSRYSYKHAHCSHDCIPHELTRPHKICG
jgi:hypothetical protein